MKESKLELGRSIADLMEENVMDIKENEEVLEIDLDVIKPNPNQPRTVFDEKSLSELANSIKEHGVFQPVILKPAGTGFILVAGERRVKAAKMVGLKTIPSIVRDYNSIYLMELAILENLQREDLTPIEEAIAFQKALHDLKLTHEELGKKIGKSRVYVTNIIGLLNLPTTVIDSVNRGVISMGHARALSKMRNQKLCVSLHDKILTESLTVRETESIIRNLTNQTQSHISKEYIKSKKEYLDGVFKDKLKYKLNKTQLVFQFDNTDELENIIEMLTIGDKS